MATLRTLHRAMATVSLTTATAQEPHIIVPARTRCARRLGSAMSDPEDRQAAKFRSLRGSVVLSGPTTIPWYKVPMVLSTVSWHLL